MTTHAEQLDLLLSEPIDAARRRQSTAFELIAGDRVDNIVLFGAGSLGRRTVVDLRADGIEPLAIADNNPGRWGSDVEGLIVLSPDDAAARFGTMAIFVVTIWTAGSPHRLADTMAQLQGLGCQRVAPFAWLAWRHPQHMLPHYAIDMPTRVLSQAQAVRAAFDLLSDSQSEAEYVEQVRWRLTGDPGCLRSPVDGAQYLVDDVARARSDESFLDCGAYDGDTLRDWLATRGPSFQHYLALEPDSDNRRRLDGFVGSLPAAVADRISVLPYAVGASTGTVTFDNGGTASSSVGIASRATGTSTEVDCIRIDELVTSLHHPTPTFVKLDIEGAEPEALAGAATFISRHSPLLALCVYHRQNHLWEIPLQVASLRPDYSFYLRPHNEEGWDLVCYAVPPSRVLA